MAVARPSRSFLMASSARSDDDQADALFGGKSGMKSGLPVIEKNAQNVRS
jgi:hypothetical protein